MTTCDCCAQFVDTIEEHHVLPKSLGGIDAVSNLVNVCHSCHGLIHNINRLDIRQLTKSGLAAAKARGVKLGAPRGNQYAAGKLKQHDTYLVRDVLTMHKKKLSSRDIARMLGSRYTAKQLSHVTVQRIIRRYNIKQGA